MIIKKLLLSLLLILIPFTINAESCDMSKFKLESINLHGLEKWDTKNVTNMQGTFYYCSSLNDFSAQT